MNESEEETARLILIEQEELGNRSAGEYIRSMREYHPGLSTVELQHVWEKYMGMDGRKLPTHDLYTGERY